jgi:uncharacterized protein YbjT (DUF2867 family)
LLTDGWHVRALVRDDTTVAATALAAAGAELVRGDLEDPTSLEAAARGLGVPVTVLRPAGFMEDFTSPARFFRNTSLNVPWRDDLVTQLIAVDDIGAYAALAFADPCRYLGKAIEITGDRLTAPQIADALSTAAGRPIPHTQIPLAALREHAPEAAKVFTWVNERYYDTDLAPLREAHPRLMDFSTWLNRSGQARLLADSEFTPA